MLDPRSWASDRWRLLLYALVVGAVVAGFVAQMMRGECPV